MKFASHSGHQLARELFHAMMMYQQKLEHRQLLMSRLVNIGTDLFAMASACSSAVSKVQKNPADKSAVELADLFCRQASSRIRKQFHGLHSNNDRFTYDLAQKALDGRYAWLEAGIIDPE